MHDRTLIVLATDARINERLVARGMDPMRGPRLTEILNEATGQTWSSRDALRDWLPDRLAEDPRVREVLIRHVAPAA